MRTPDDPTICRTIDSFWRAPTQRCDPEVRFVDAASGWVRFVPGLPAGEFASITPTRLSWAARTAPLTPELVLEAEAAIRACALQRVFVWVPPAAWTPETDAMMRARGAMRIEPVRYLGLVRRAEPISSPAGSEVPRCPFALRVLTRDDAPRVLEAIAPWFGADAIPRALRRVELGAAEFHAAFGGDEPVALAAVLRMGEWAYLGWAGTSPAHRGRGAQTALLHARVCSAAQSGAAWCVAETVTAEETSLRNLLRCGFEPRIDWRVYRWDPPGPDASPAPPAR